RVFGQRGNRSAFVGTYSAIKSTGSTVRPASSKYVHNRVASGRPQTPRDRITLLGAGKPQAPYRHSGEGLQLTTHYLFVCVIHRSSSKRHIGNAWILGAGAGHTGSVGYEYI